jgi:hypothetical protein
MLRCQLILVLLAVVAAAPAATADRMAADPATAANELRRLQYRGEAEQVFAYLAPAAPGFVDRKSKQATAENIARMAAGVYGFEVLAGQAEGDAGCTVMLAAWTDGSGPKVELFPFYLWRQEGAWHYLPNPLEVETWYQSVPDELEGSFDRLQVWYQAEVATHAARMEADPATLIADWAAAAAAEP